MTYGALSMAVQGIAASACATLGLSLLTKQPGPSCLQLAGLGAAIVLWAGLWHALAPMAGAAFSIFAPDQLGWVGVAGLNMATATVAWLPAWLVLRHLGPPSPFVSVVGAMGSLTFAAGLILPWLGQAGTWPAESIVLVIWCAVLVLMMRGRRHRQGN